MMSEYVNCPSRTDFQGERRKTFSLPFSTRSLPHRFFVSPLSIFRAASPLTLRTMTTNRKTQHKTACYAGHVCGHVKKFYIVVE